MAKFFWTQKQEFGPKPRRGHALAYDSQRQRTVLFGGEANIIGLFDDTWEWNGENWTQITDLGPGPRTEFAMTFDSQRNKTVLFGGLTSADRKLNDTWEWDGENWTQVEDGGPTARSGHAMAFDPIRKRAVLFGGSTAAGLAADTWEWDGSQWTQTGEAGPAAREDAMLAYDAGLNQLILFGGWNGDASFHDTWGWDGGTWTQQADIGPDARHHAALVSAENRLVLFGGQLMTAPPATPQMDGTTWEWVGKKWVQRTDFGPPARGGHAMAYDDARRQLVLFGGLLFAVSEPAQVLVGRLLGDTWEHAVAPAPTVPPGPAVPPPPGGGGPAGIFESFTLTPNTASFEAIAAGHPFTLLCTIRLNGLFLDIKEVVIVGDPRLGPPTKVRIQAAQIEISTNIVVTGGAPVGTYTYHATLPGSDITATFTIT
jgi:hypothetical protein